MKLLNYNIELSNELKLWTPSKQCFLDYSYTIATEIERITTQKNKRKTRRHDELTFSSNFLTIVGRRTQSTEVR